jgi:hypothetical protein
MAEDDFRLHPVEECSGGGCTVVLAPALERLHRTSDDLWRQAHEAQEFIVFLAHDRATRC